MPPAAIRTKLDIEESGAVDDEKVGSGPSKPHLVGIETSSTCPIPNWPEPLEPKAKSGMISDFFS